MPLRLIIAYILIALLVAVFVAGIAWLHYHSRRATIARNRKRSEHARQKRNIDQTAESASTD